MGVMRRLKDAAETAIKAIEDSGEMTPEKLAKLTPAEHERYEMWTAHTEQLRAGGAAVDVTRGKTQAKDVAAHLAACGVAARPDLVYGLYRVPDRIRPSAGPEGRQVVEWDIVHAATAPLPPADAPADVHFDAGATWVERRIGEPSILDEDLALAYLNQAGIGPEHTLGVRATSRSTTAAATATRPTRA